MSATSSLPQNIRYGDVILTLSLSEIYVEFSPEFSMNVTSYMEENNLELVQEDPESFGRSFNELDPNQRWFNLSGTQSLDTLLGKMNEDHRVRIASPIYYREDLLPAKTALTFSNHVLVKIRLETSLAAQQKLFKEFGEIASALLKLKDGRLFRLKINDPKKNNAIEVSTKIASSKVVKDARPDWMSLTSSLSIIPNDIYVLHQWALPRIGASDGWDLSRGRRGVVISVLDTGCDLIHEDLNQKYVQKADMHNVIDGSNNPDDLVGHGTWCAGLAAAETNNMKGIAGIAWDCLIMPVKFIPDTMRIRSEADIVAAILWSVRHGSNVISMSWHWPGPHIDADLALTEAHKRNLILVAAAGNENSRSLNYPASHPAVIAVGATDQMDLRKTPKSPDLQCWGSNYGTGLSVMAPGVLLWTTDPTGCLAGFNRNKGGPQRINDRVCIDSPCSGSMDCNYWSLMGGTSGATSLVAGLAALLLSRNPKLRNRKAREIIEKTARKLHGYKYKNNPSLHPNGRWNEEVGYGMIDIPLALRKAK